MKLLIRRLKSEAGQVLPMALVLMALGGLLVVPMLSLMTTNLTANRMIDRANMEVYAADAGVENVMWEIMYNQKGFTLPKDGEPTKSVPIPTPGINGTTVTATISKVPNQTNIYKITSIATSPDGHSTKVECLVNAGSKYSFLLDSAITSAGTVNTQPGTTVNGDIVYAAGGTSGIKGTVTGTITKDTTLPTRWPTELELNEFYDINNQTKLPLFLDNKIDLKNYPGPIVNIGPFRRNGSLTIDNSGGTGKTLRLNGTIYITGDLTFAQTGASDYTFDLNNQVIYVKGNITFAADKVPIIGSGCIIAVGTINLTPKTICSSPNEYVLIISVTKSTTIKPNGNFYGSVAGFTDVTLQPGTCITGTPPEDLKFPGMGGGAGSGLGGKARMLTYTINPP